MPRTARQTKEERRIERLVDDAFSRTAQGVEINVFDIRPICDAGRAAARAGGDVDAAVRDAIAQYRKN